MFASQLSRILQALPADVNYDACREEKTSMKENQPEIICISDGNKEADVFSFGKKGVLGSNGVVADSDNSDEFSKARDLDCSLESVENESEGLQVKDDPPNGLFRFIARKTGEEDALLASDTKDSNRYSPELPKLIVCYQESNYYPVRDICVNKAGVSGKVLVESQKDDCAGTNNVSVGCDGDKNNDIRDGSDTELLSGDRSTLQADAMEFLALQKPPEEAGHTAISTTEALEPETEPCQKEGNPEKTLAMPMPMPCSPELQDSEDKAKGSHSITNRDQYGDGEASFSGLSSVTYSGLIPYSGSISLRSDSSTTSTRSFAFPILQSEWNSSPVKMIKSDRRLQKHRGWRQGLLCCRF
nr:uncharacterized protein LOC109160812 [Ipomoea batatas]